MKKAKYIGADDYQVRWGNHDDPRGVLVEGQEYEIEYIDVHDWHTKVKLVGINGNFNSVCFEMIDDDDDGHPIYAMV